MSKETQEEQPSCYTADSALEIIAYWQPRLRLCDWRFRVEMKKNLPGSAWGEFHHNLHRRDALIKLVRPDAYKIDPNTEAAQLEPWYHWERTIVHEIVHALLLPMTANYERGSFGETFEEHAVHTLADALVAARYGK